MLPTFSFNKWQKRHYTPIVYDISYWTSNVYQSFSFYRWWRNVLRQIQLMQQLTYSVCFRCSAPLLSDTIYIEFIQTQPLNTLRMLKKVSKNNKKNLGKSCQILFFLSCEPWRLTCVTTRQSIR